MKMMLIGLLLAAMSCNAVDRVEDVGEHSLLLKGLNVSVGIHEAPDGKVLYRISNDSLDEVFYVLNMKSVDGKWLKVQPVSITDTSNAAGWINIENVGIYTSNYNRPLMLYKSPKKSDQYLFKINDYHPEMLPVFEYKDGWLLVELIVDGKINRGWLSPQDQCANPYSTCN